MDRYVIRGGREGYERLKVLARARRSDTLALLDLVGVRPGWRCIDVGCGGGDVTFEIARLVGPDGHVVGVDMDEVKLELAREAAGEMGLAHVEFRVANVSDWNEHDAYDLVYSRFLLHHLSRPVELLERMWAAVRSGGCLAVEDVDFDGLFCHPPNDGFAFHARTYPQVVERRGGDPTIGRKLYRCFVDVGIPDPGLRLVQGVASRGDTKTIALLTLEAAAEAIVAEGVASEDEVRSAHESLASFLADPTTISSNPRIFQVWSARP